MCRITTPLLFIGCGNMGGALVRGGFDAGVLSPELVGVCDPDPDKRGELGRLGAAPFADIAELLDWGEETETEAGSAQIVLAVKPQMFETVAKDLAPLLTTRRVVVSILAGTTSGKIRGELGGHAAVVRVMPNTPASVGRGMSAIAVGAGASDADAESAEALLNAVGETVRIGEDLMDAFTGLAGSGPAYVFYLAEAMARAGESVGFGRDTALRVARQTVAGAGELLARSDLDPETLRANVTSKGGTTAAATGVFDEAGLMEIVERAITAARDRGRELGG